MVPRYTKHGWRCFALIGCQSSMTPDALIEAWVRSITHSHLVLGHLNPKGWVGKWPLAHSDQAHMKWEFSNQIEPAWGTSLGIRACARSCPVTSLTNSLTSFLMVKKATRVFKSVLVKFYFKYGSMFVPFSKHIIFFLCMNFYRPSYPSQICKTLTVEPWLH